MLKIFISYFITFFIPLLVVFVIASTTQKQMLYQQILSLQQITVQQQAAQFENEIDRFTSAALSLSNRPYFKALADRERSELTNQDYLDMRNLLSDQGTLIGLGMLFRPPVLAGRPSNGAIVRKEYLDEAGITELPRTIDELTEMLRAFKRIGVEVPFAMEKLTSGSSYSFIASAYGVKKRDFFIKDGVVTHSFLEAGYRDYIELLRMWMEEGLISRDFITGHDVKQMITTGKTGMVYTSNAASITMQSLGEAENEAFHLVGIQYPRLSDPDAEITLGFLNLPFTNEGMYVTTACKHPVEAVRFLDYLYSDEAIKLCAWGTGEVDGNVTWTEDENGVRTFTDYAKKNPDMDFNTFRGRWTLGELTMCYEQQMESQQYSSDMCQDNWDKWTYNYNNKNALLMHLTPTADESLLKFILGETPMDEYDKFVEQVKKLGIEDAAAIYETVYQRYMAR